MALDISSYHDTLGCLQNPRFVKAKARGSRSRGVFSLNPGILNPDPWRFRGSAKASYEAPRLPSARWGPQERKRPV